MQRPVHIVFRDMEPSPALETRIRERIARLDRVMGQLTSCEVAVKMPHRQKRQGNLFEIRIQVRYPGGEVDVSHQGGENHAHEDMEVVVRDAFTAAERQLTAKIRKQDHKQHEGHMGPPRGKIVRLFPQEGYGFIETADGTEVYFEEDSVVDGNFYEFETGDEVRVAFSAAETAKGLQATTVRPIGKHHLSEPPRL